MLFSTQKRVFDMRVELGDPCPVCAVVYSDSHSIYCSKSCRMVAYNFRKRLSATKVFLEGLGFLMGYYYGVQLSTGLPGYMRHAYPVSLRSFDYPYPSMAIETVNAGQYWCHLIFEFGPAVAGFMRWLFETQFFATDEQREMLQLMIKPVLAEPSEYFACDQCEKKFIYSDSVCNAPRSPGIRPFLCSDFAYR